MIIKLQVLASGKAVIAAEVARTLKSLLEGASGFTVSPLTNAPSATPGITSVCPMQQLPEAQQSSMMYLAKLDGGAQISGDVGLGVDWALVLDVVHELIEVNASTAKRLIIYTSGESVDFILMNLREESKCCFYCRRCYRS